MSTPKIHHLNCATMCPMLARALVHPSGGLVCHCLLIEGRSGLVLVDSGLGLDDVKNPRGRLGGGFLSVAGPKLDDSECAVKQVERLGFKADDVRDVVVTHLDLDHAGGLSDFPRARVHLDEAEHDAAMKRATQLEKHRYRPPQFAHSPNWATHRAGGERWFGFESVRALDEGEPEILIIPLRGHTRGHAGIAVRTDTGWILHAGDAYFAHTELDEEAPRAPAALTIFQKIVAIDEKQRIENQRRLRELAKEQRTVRVFCAHDPDEFSEMMDYSSSIPRTFSSSAAGA